MIVEFVRELFDGGRVRVGHPDRAESSESQDELLSFLQDCEAVHRRSFPGTAPPLLAEVAVWSTRVFYRACQAATFRNLPAELLPEFLGEPAPPGDSAARHYSADLVLQFLPDLIKLTGHVAPNDPLVTILKTWANQWPLSSIGINGVQPESLAGIVDHPAVLACYVDRVIARRDVTRLNDATVLASVRRSLGLHASQFPEFLPHLRSSPPCNLTPIRPH